MARYYRADLGRFISVDPVPSYNPYAYCDNDPVNKVDPTGLRPDLRTDFEKRIYNDPIGNAIFLGPSSNQPAITRPTGTGQNNTSTMLLSNRKPGKTPPKSWPPLPDNLAGKKPKWNPEGYWEGAKGDHAWDDRSHGSGVDRGYGPQDGHWDDEKVMGVGIGTETLFQLHQQHNLLHGTK